MGRHVEGRTAEVQMSASRSSARSACMPPSTRLGRSRRRARRKCSSSGTRCSRAVYPTTFRAPVSTTCWPGTAPAQPTTRGVGGGNPDNRGGTRRAHAVPAARGVPGRHREGQPIDHQPSHDERGNPHCGGRGGKRAAQREVYPDCQRERTGGTIGPRLVPEWTHCSLYAQIESFLVRATMVRPVDLPGFRPLPPR